MLAAGYQFVDEMAEYYQAAATIEAGILLRAAALPRYRMPRTASSPHRCSLRCTASNAVCAGDAADITSLCRASTWRAAATTWRQR